jgi:hypothetical protein
MFFKTHISNQLEEEKDDAKNVQNTFMLLFLLNPANHVVWFMTLYNLDSLK